MFNIKSYIKKPHIPIYDLDEVLENPAKYFIPLDDSQRIEAIKDEIDHDYIEGCIILKYNHNTIMNFRLWDLVDQLWAYFINIIEEFLKNKYAETFFPDQPVKIELTYLNNDFILFSITASFGKKSYTLPKKDFFNSILNSAEYFFEKMMNLLNIKEFNYQLERIKLLRNKINHKS